MLQFQPKNSDKKGFSLIELLVVIGIIGVLAAVAIPAYQRYQDDAERNSLVNSLQNIGKAQIACGILKDFANCILLPDIDVACSDCATPTSAAGPAYPWCVSAMNGDAQACVSIQGRANAPVIVNNWEGPICANANINGTGCTGSGTGVVSGTCPAGCTTPTNSACTGTGTPASIPCTGGSGTPARGTPMATRTCTLGACA